MSYFSKVFVWIVFIARVFSMEKTEETFPFFCLPSQIQNVLLYHCDDQTLCNLRLCSKSFKNLVDNPIYPKSIEKKITLLKFRKFLKDLDQQSKSDDLFQKEINKILYKWEFNKGELTRIPNAIYNYAETVIIHFKNHEIFKISKRIGQLKKMTILDLGGNKIRYIPSAIGELAQLEALILSQNPLKSFPSEVIEKLPKLKSLHLSFQIGKAAEDRKRLEDVCKKRGIALEITDFI